MKWTYEDLQLSVYHEPACDALLAFSISIKPNPNFEEWEEREGLIEMIEECAFAFPPLSLL